MSVARRELHAPKEHCVLGADDRRLLKKAGRLNKVADEVASMDLKSIAAAYQRQSGCSALEAAGVAADTLNAALRASLAGPGGAEAAESEARKLARKKALSARNDALRTESAAQEAAAEAARPDLHAALAHRAERAIASKEERLAEAVAERRAQRELRQVNAQTRRSLSEAQARFGDCPYLDEYKSGRQVDPSLLASDPVLRRAQQLCSGARGVISSLEGQNEMLRRKAEALTTMPKPTLPQRAASSSARVASVGATAEGERLLARARELLVDYHPPEHHRRPPVPSAATGPRSPTRRTAAASEIDNDGAAKLAHARKLCASVTLEMDTGRRR
mmetsp:Transcript_27310/g.75967  ORF Transcript_27310/g.75967 Transcript_27310/m.75967 type:complete len:333 (-) Transcript_27310:110-1108(-)